MNTYKLLQIYIESDTPSGERFTFVEALLLPEDFDPLPLLFFPQQHEATAPDGPSLFAA